MNIIFDWEQNKQTINSSFKKLLSDNPSHPLILRFCDLKVQMDEQGGELSHQFVVEFTKLFVEILEETK